MGRTRDAGRAMASIGGKLSHKLRTLCRLAHAGVTEPGFILTPRSHILVLGHMRSYSTLLSHLLGSHPQIAGYLETHQQYRGPWTLPVVRGLVSHHGGSKPAATYVLDKVVHNRCRIARAMLAREDVRVVFLVRRPEGALPSLLRRYESLGIDGDIHAAARYYAARLDRLARYAAVRRSALYVEAERLLDDTAATLRSLERYLELSVPLEPRYRVFRDTGRIGGDWGPTIRRGEIVRHARPPVQLDPAVLSRVQAAYDACTSLLRARFGRSLKAG